MSRARRADEILVRGAGPSGGSGPCGSGTVVGDRYVLTAAHVLWCRRRHERRFETLSVQVGGVGRELPVTDWWPKELPEADILLLQVDGDLPKKAMWNDGAVAKGEFSAFGYPEYEQGADHTDGHPEKGEVLREQDGLLHLRVPDAPESWGGMSGAGVFMGGTLVAIWSQADPRITAGSGPTRHRATPLHRVRDAEWFHRIRNSGLDEQRSKLLVQLKASLGEHPKVAERLDDVIEVLPESPGIPAELDPVERLVRLDLSDVAYVLAEACEDIVDEHGPHALDGGLWASVCDLLRSTHAVHGPADHITSQSAPGGRVGLPVTGPEGAEVIQAAGDGRRPELLPAGGVGFAGRFQVNRPLELDDDLPMRPDQEAIEQRLGQNVKRTLILDGNSGLLRDHLRHMLRMREVGANDEAAQKGLQDAINTKLLLDGRFKGRGARRHRKVRYILVPTQASKATANGAAAPDAQDELDEGFRRLVKAVESTYPHLRVVFLAHDAPAHARGQLLVSNLVRLHGLIHGSGATR